MNSNSGTLSQKAIAGYGPVRFSYNLSFLSCFLVGTVFFSHNKSARTVFRFVFSAKRTRPIAAAIAGDLKLWPGDMADSVDRQLQAGRRLHRFDCLGALDRKKCAVLPGSSYPGAGTTSNHQVRGGDVGASRREEPSLSASSSLECHCNLGRVEAYLSFNLAPWSV